MQRNRQNAWSAMGRRGDIDAQSLQETLKSHGPYWVAGNWGSGSHVIVVTACNPETGTIRYVDPWKNYMLAASPGTISWLKGAGVSGKIVMPV